MLIIWRGWGLLVPVVVVATFVLTAMIMEPIFGKDEFDLYGSGGIVFTLLSSGLVGVLGYYFNVKRRKVYKDEETGERVKSSTHTFFFIPMQYWALVLPALLSFLAYTDMQGEKKMQENLAAPQINDYYLVDYSKMYTDATEYKFGLMKVKNVSGDSVELFASSQAYTKKAGAREDVKKNKDGAAGYYDTVTESYTSSTLLEMQKAGAIYEVVRR